MIRVISAIGNVLKIIPQEYFQDYLKRRGKLGIRFYGIHPKDEIARKLIRITPKIDKIVLIPLEKYKFPADVAIYDNNIGFMSSEGEGFAIGIESEELAGIMKKPFRYGLRKGKKANQEL